VIRSRLEYRFSAISLGGGGGFKVRDTVFHTAALPSITTVSAWLQDLVGMAEVGKTAGVVEDGRPLFVDALLRVSGMMAP